MLNIVFNQLVTLVKAMLPLLGAGALGATERAVTLPESDIRHMMAGTTPEQTDHAITLWRKAADAVSDAVVFTASKGKIVED